MRLQDPAHQFLRLGPRDKYPGAHGELHIHEIGLPRNILQGHVPFQGSQGLEQGLLLIAIQDLMGFQPQHESRQAQVVLQKIVENLVDLLGRVGRSQFRAVNSPYFSQQHRHPN